MQKLPFFSEAADYLSIISKDYQFGLPDTSDEISKIFDFNNGVSLFGSIDSELLFVTCSRTNCINEFLENKDGSVLASLVKNALNLSTSGCAYLLVTGKVDEIEESYFAKVKSLKKIVFFGEEFLTIESLVESEQHSFFNTYSLQEIRNSKSIKKDFWSKFKVFFES